MLTQRKLDEVLQVSHKKSKGCYYTPDFIVRYITEQAISQTLLVKINTSQNKIHLNSFQELRKKKDENLYTILLNKILPNFTVCDISMGWGVFLLHAFDYLFSLYREAFMILEGNFSDKIVFIIKSIIENNLYGMDLSEISIELAKLKFVEKAGGYFQKEVYSLPLFNFNSGNSLVEDFWGKNFDVIIGNPPYINVKKIPIEERKLYSSMYQTYNPNGDISNIFWERSLQLCKTNGLVSFIVPRYWLEGNDSNRLRKYLLDNSTIFEIIDFRSNRSLFYSTESKLGVDTAIVSVRKGGWKKNTISVFISTNDKPIAEISKSNLKHLTYNQERLTEKKWNFEKTPIIDFIEEHADFNLGDDKKYDSFNGICNIGKGSSTGNNKIFRLKHISGNVYEGLKGIKVEVNDFEKQALRQLIKNSDISRYRWKPRNEFWIFLKNQNINDFPNIESYLDNFRDSLNQMQTKYKTRNYYDYAAYRSLDLMNRYPKIVTPYQANYNKFALISENSLLSINETDVITIVIKDNFEKIIDQFYLLSILNSDLIRYYSQRMNKKVYNLLDFRSNQIASFPIMKCNNSSIYQALVEALIQLKHQFEQSGSVNYDFTTMTDILNCLIFELYFREKLSTTLHDSFDDYLESLELGDIATVVPLVFYQACKKASNQETIRNNIKQINSLSEVKEIRKAISS